MASTNSDSLIWVAGETTGTTGVGGTAVAPPVPYVVSTSSTAPTDAPDGLPFYLADEDFYLWDGAAWVGPYSLAT